MLKSVLGFILVAGVVEPGDVTETVDLLGTIQTEATSEFIPPLQALASVLRDIDDGATAGDGRTIDTSSAEPAAREPVRLCRSKKLAVPSI